MSISVVNLYESRLTFRSNLNKNTFISLRILTPTAPQIHGRQLQILYLQYFHLYMQKIRLRKKISVIMMMAWYLDCEITMIGGSMFAPSGSNVLKNVKKCIPNTY
jgi:hypothetical protein